MGYSENERRRKWDNNDPEKFFYDLRGIMQRAKREGIPVTELKLREEGVEKQVILSIISKIGDLILPEESQG